MKKFIPYTLALFIGTLIFSSLIFSSAQTTGGDNKEDLQNKKEKLQKEINELNQQLEITKKSKNSSLSQLTILQKQIASRQSLINNYNGQISQLAKSIDATNSRIDSLNNSLAALKKDYSQMVYYAYKHRSEYSELLFLFSAQSFNEALMRLKYLKCYTAYRQSQVRQIGDTKTSLTNQMKLLLSQKSDRVRAANEQVSQAGILKTQQYQQNVLVYNLSKQEKKIKADINTKTAAANKLNAQIAAIIKKEMDALAKKSGAPKGSSGAAALPTEVKELSASFLTNYGKLPWPVSSGFISESFGKHQHPVLKYVTTNNFGIDISTSKGAAVKSVFKGNVVSVIYSPVFRKGVIVNHGEYYSVYTMLENVNVKAGDAISTQQTIGTVYTDTDKGTTIVHLEIWKGSEKTNPELWLQGH